MTAATHAALLPLKVFFLLVVLLISVLLAVHHKKLESEESRYRKNMLRIEVGLLVGSIGMLFFPLMSEAYIQSAGALFGIAARGPFATMMPIVSFLFLIWALLTGLFFYRRKANERLVSAARMGGVVVSNIGIIKYNLLIAAVAWALGAGASKLGPSAYSRSIEFAIWDNYPSHGWRGFARTTGDSKFRLASKAEIFSSADISSEL
jgi:hypothetical protein